jgi:hypothetical protein
VVLKWLMASRRAFADEYAVRVNRAVELLVELTPADAVRALQAEHALSERQARRYVNVAIERPDGVAVPERASVFTVRLAPSLITGLRDRAHASGDVERDRCGGGEVVSRSRPGATRWRDGLRSSSSVTGSPVRGWRGRTRSWCPSDAG